ncbi:hypothetical protein [Pseudothauera lacus]|uniref:Uncharacterized protein n=1 Tax=Pseudothauera lacus TaxID=2136175 RepID=A0A2T4IGZ6_9RHOO|nr:hypothetical protein [Pseudothauera lacus]PTD96986.1 hypothetical protein C8261_06195 [Pseudothauera lacus]
MPKTALPRFHLPTADGLYQAIPFVFVSERMLADILAERRALLDALPTAQRARQQQLFARYDPQLSGQAFQDILTLFGTSGRR